MKIIIALGDWFQSLNETQRWFIAFVGVALGVALGNLWWIWYK